MCAHGTSAAGACSSTALTGEGVPVKEQLQDLRRALHRLAAAVMWRNGEQLEPLGNTVFYECVDTHDAPIMIMTVPSIDKNRDGIPDVTQSGAATTISDSQEIGLLQDMHTKVAADAGAELTIKTDLPVIGLLQNVHTKGMAKLRRLRQVKLIDRDPMNRHTTTAIGRRHSPRASLQRKLLSRKTLPSSRPWPSPVRTRGGVACVRWHAQNAAAPTHALRTTLARNVESTHIRECAACAWYACEARLPREARRRRGRGRHWW